VYERQQGGSTPRQHEPRENLPAQLGTHLLANTSEQDHNRKSMFGPLVIQEFQSWWVAASPDDKDEAARGEDYYDGGEARDDEVEGGMVRRGGQRGGRGGGRGPQAQGQVPVAVVTRAAALPDIPVNMRSALGKLSLVHLSSSFLEFWHSKGRPRGTRCSGWRHWRRRLVPSPPSVRWREARQTPWVAQDPSGQETGSEQLQVMPRPAARGANSASRRRRILGGAVRPPHLQYTEVGHDDTHFTDILPHRFF
jgi:hypothetical protein